MVANFFHLPRELRDEVYSYLVSGTAPFRFSSDNNITLLAKGQLDGPTSTYPSWLLPNKAIHHESIEYLQRIGSVELTINKKAWYADDFYDAQTFAPFRPLQIRQLHINLLNLEDTGNLPNPDPKHRRYPYQILVSAMDYMTHVLDDIAGLGKLEVPRLTMKSIPGVSSPKNIHLVISRVLPQLRRFEYDVKKTLFRNHVLWTSYCATVERGLTWQIGMLNSRGMAGLVLQSKDNIAKARVRVQGIWPSFMALRLASRVAHDVRTRGRTSLTASKAGHLDMLNY
jgi:hypothetical protein